MGRDKSMQKCTRTYPTYKIKHKLGMVTHDLNPSTQKAEADTV